jgi:hypothetical protein
MHKCAFCDRRGRRRTSSRPAVPLPHTTAPGQNVHVDVAYFRHPHTGPFRALIATDKFSNFVMSGVVDGTLTAATTAAVFLRIIDYSYVRVTYDLGSNFRSSAFKSLLERLGSQAWDVPADAHWPSAAEKIVDLLRVELDAVWEECQDISAVGGLAAATHRLNDRST